MKASPFPAIFDVTYGQNEYVTGGHMRGGVIHFGGSAPFSPIPGLYAFGAMDVGINNTADKPISAVLTPFTGSVPDDDTGISAGTTASQSRPLLTRVRYRHPATATDSPDPGCFQCQGETSDRPLRPARSGGRSDGPFIHPFHISPQGMHHCCALPPPAWRHRLRRWSLAGERPARMIDSLVWQGCFEFSTGDCPEWRLSRFFSAVKYQM